MSNQKSHPLVPPSEYERNKGTIASYRAYLDVYERMNEQGLRNHEEVERLERGLQEKIRAGEEAKRALEMLESSRKTLRLTDGQTLSSELSNAPPLVIPTVQAPSNTAYIEELPSQEQRQSPIASTSYAPYATPRSHAPQVQNVAHSSYHNSQQWQPYYNAPSQAGAYYRPQMERNGVAAVGTQAPQPQPSRFVQKPTHYTQPHQSTTLPPHQPHQPPAPPVNHSPPAQAQAQAPAPAQHHPPIQTIQGAMHPPNQRTQYQQNYHFQAQEQIRQVNTGQQASQAAQFSAQYRHYRMPVNQVQVPNQQYTNNSQTQSGAQQRTNVSQQVTSNFQASEPKEAQTQAMPAVITPPTAPSNIVNIAKQAASSSLEGALGSASPNAVQPPRVATPGSNLVSGHPTQQAALSTSAKGTSIAIANTSLVNHQTSTYHPQAPSRQPHNDVAPPTAVVLVSEAVSKSPPPTQGLTSSSPLRTPSQADKKHLARDLLRALKRPRLETSPPSIQEHAAKRQTLENTIKQSTSIAPFTQVPLTIMPAQASSSAPTTQPLQTQFNTYQSVFSIRQPEYRPGAASINVQPPPVTSNGTSQSVPAARPAPTPSSTPAPTSAPVPMQQNNAPRTAYSIPGTFVQPYGSKAGIAPQAYSMGGKVPQSYNRETFRSGTNTDTPSIAKPPPATTSMAPSPSTLVSDSSAVPVAEASAELVTGPSDSSSSVTSPVIAASSKIAPVVKAAAEGALANGDQPGSGRAVPSKMFDKPANIPLFLPSPTSSPTLGANNGPIDGLPQLSIDKEDEKSEVPVPSSRSSSESADMPSLTSNLIFAHVLVPRLPPYVKKWKLQQRKLAQGDDLDTIERDLLQRDPRSLSPSLSQFHPDLNSRSPSASAVPVSSVKLVRDENEDGAMEEPSEMDLNFSNYDEAEREVLVEHCTRLRESFCRWQDCDVALNTPGALLKHLDVEHGPKRSSVESPWTCQWVGCGYTGISTHEYRQHAEKHAIFPIWCPYKNCTENFRTPRQMIRHKRNDHGSDAVLRPTAQPMAISVQPLELMSHVPKILPSYMTEYRAVRPASINKSRHEVVMPSVLRRISGNVPAQLQGYNAARPMPVTPSGTSTTPPVNTPYSFLEHRSTRYSSYLSSPAKSKNVKSLDSGYVTNLVKKGLVLWPEKENDEAMPEAMIQELEQDDGALEEEEGYDVFGPTAAIVADTEPEKVKVEPSDEEAVELMLMHVPTG